MRREEEENLGAERTEVEEAEAAGAEAENAEAEITEAARAEAENAEAEIAEAEKAEAERTEDESAEAERTEDERAEAERKQTKGRRGASSTASEGELRRGKMEEEAVQKLLQIPAGQFLKNPKFSSLEEAIRSGPGLLDCFSGRRGFATALVKRGAPWALCWDLRHHASENLLSRDTQSNLLSLVSLGAFAAMSSSPVCASFSTAITPPWRNLEYPEGRPDLTEEQRVKVDIGHQQLKFTLRLCELCLQHGVHFWIENPEQSWFWKQEDRLSWQKILRSGRVANSELISADSTLHGGSARGSERRVIWEASSTSAIAENHMFSFVGGARKLG